MIVGSIGIGLLALILVWILTLIVFVVAIKFQSNIAWFVLGFATTLTLVLVIIPLENIHDITVDKATEKDYNFVYSAILLSILSISALAIFILFLITHCLERIYPKSIKHFYAVQ